jgi:5-formyltetrahydrofolate cyclo-ligase
VTSADPDGPAGDKQAARLALLARRRARPESERQAARDALTEALLEFIDDAAVVCGYLPLGTEPVAPDLPALLTKRGIGVLLPRARAGQALDWCAYGFGSRRGSLGIEEPLGPGLGTAAVRSADVVLVPALAVDPRGNRLGRGGGHYDRTLALVGTGSRTVAVVFDDEVVEAVPVGPHDVPVRFVATPSSGVQALPR